MGVLHMCVLCWQRPEEDIRFAPNGVLGKYELSCWLGNKLNSSASSGSDLNHWAIFPCSGLMIYQMILTDSNWISLWYWIFKTYFKDWQYCSVDKVVCCKAWQHDFPPQDPYGGRRELIPSSCLLISTHAL